MVERASAVLKEQFERDSIFKLFDENPRRRVLLECSRERDGGPVHEVLFERDCGRDQREPAASRFPARSRKLTEVVCLDTEVDLAHHHLAKHLHLLGKAEPLHPGERVERLGEKHHNLEVATDLLLDTRVEDLDCDSRARFPLRALVVRSRGDGAREAGGRSRVVDMLQGEVV